MFGRKVWPETETIEVKIDREVVIRIELNRALIMEQFKDGTPSEVIDEYLKILEDVYLQPIFQGLAHYIVVLLRLGPPLDCYLLGHLGGALERLVIFASMVVGRVSKTGGGLEDRRKVIKDLEFSRAALLNVLRREQEKRESKIWNKIFSSGDIPEAG